MPDVLSNHMGAALSTMCRRIIAVCVRVETSGLLTNHKLLATGEPYGQGAARRAGLRRTQNTPAWPR